MKRLVIGLAIGVLGGTVGGFALGIFVYPYWFLRDEARESLVAGVARSAVATGSFIHVNTRDPVHWGRGGVTLYNEGPGRAVVHLEPDFEVGPGPRFHVYLASRAEVAHRADFEAGERIDLGRLRAFKGSQVYAVPPGADLARFASVVIWCKEFDVLNSPARLVRK